MTQREIDQAELERRKLNDQVIGVVPPHPDKPKPKILRSKEELAGVEAEGPMQVPPSEDAPEAKKLVSVEEARLEGSEVSYQGPEVIESDEKQKDEQSKAASVSPTVADAPAAPKTAPEANAVMKKAANAKESHKDAVKKANKKSK